MHDQREVAVADHADRREAEDVDAQARENNGSVRTLVGMIWMV